MSEQLSQSSQTNGHVEPAPTAVVRRFLELLQEQEVDRAMDLLAPDVRYINVSLPVIRGRDRVQRAFQAANRMPGAGFEVYFHTISADGAAVMTERTDVLLFGPVRLQIWVCGRFDVRDGLIELWKDYFDWWNFLTATVRGLVGAVVPALRPRPPEITSQP